MLGQASEVLKCLQDLGNELMVEIDETHKLSQLTCSSRLWKLADGFNFAFQ